MILPVLAFVFALVLEWLLKPGLKNGNKRSKNVHKCSQFQKYQFVTKVPYIVTKVPYCYKSALLLQKCPIESYKSALMTLQKCPRLQKFPFLVTKVPYFGYKSALSYGSLSLSLSLSLLGWNGFFLRLRFSKKINFISFYFSRKFWILLKTRLPALGLEKKKAAPK